MPINLLHPKRWKINTNTIAVALLTLSVIILLYRFDILFSDEQNFKLELTVTGGELDEETRWYFLGSNRKHALFQKNKGNDRQFTVFKFKNGKATINGYLERPGLYVLTNERFECYFPFMIDIGKQKIEVSHQHLSPDKGLLTPTPFKFSGSQLNKEFFHFWEQEEAQQLLKASKEYYQWLVKKASQQQALNQILPRDTVSNIKLQKEKRELFLAQLKLKRSNIRVLQQNASLSYLVENSNSYLALDYFLSYAYLPKYTKLDETTMKYYISLLGETLKKTRTYESIVRKYEATKKFCIGKTPPPIELPDSRGDTAMLEHFFGNVTLVNFWVMGCDYCEAEQSNLFEMYTKYYENEFEILSVSFDTDKQSWQNYLNKKGMPWHQVIDTTGLEQSSIVRAYGGLAVPTSFLLDEEGKVIAKNLRCPEFANEENYNINKQLENIYGF